MAVLKQISPTRVPVAPNDLPSKYLPSSRARSARIKFKNVQRSTLNAQRSTKIHSEFKQLDVGRSALATAEPVQGGGGLGVFRCRKKKRPGSPIDPSLRRIFTPPVPFR